MKKMGVPYFASFLLILMTSKASASDGVEEIDVHKLPYWIQDSLLQYADEIGNRSLTGPIRKIYRKDLDQNYVAYYEFQFENWCMTFSTGPKTGDHRLVEEKEAPSITDILNAQAAEVNKTCSTFFRLSPDGATICEDASGKAIASTMDLRTLTKDMNETALDIEISEALADFEEVWNAVAKKIRSSSEWKEFSVHGWPKIPSASPRTMIYKVLTPGESQDIPIGTSDASQVEINVGVEENENTLATLCSLLGFICSKTGEVEVSRILGTKKNLENLNFINFDVTDEYESIVKKLKKRSIDFYLKLSVERKFVVIRRYTIDFNHRQSKRSGWSGVLECSIDHEYLMPDYTQHMCGNCKSGCVPVAWAQIFAYYDRVAHRDKDSRYSEKLWQGINGISGKPSEEAPGCLNRRAEKYVEALRVELGTFCRNGQGATYASKTADVNEWFRQRQESGRVIKLPRRNRMKQISCYIKQNYPVLNSFWYRGANNSEKKAGHTVVITKVREKSLSYKTCRRCQWWPKTKCDWKTEHTYQWYRRMGWGRNHKENGWTTGDIGVSSFGAFVAVVGPVECTGKF
ncbi:uncharacterized protein LOC114523104 isoform X2 [Dendronephthya gigantea]|uniref:uncharacterized protein LOC114523104 isoform X2 n=1 Tax=Dendronephthya gigantea TaxID=151771 RepID=UPI00106CEBD9|nr:uncharacterized protein LOC114523104 isoform X2 [Dendronephthya gigantea]